MILNPAVPTCFVPTRNTVSKRTSRAKYLIRYTDPMRDQAWLERLLDNIWQDHFHDVVPQTPLTIQYGKKARNRLGSLSIDNKRQKAVIRLTRLFEDQDIPEMVIKATIAHELCHYAHGFSNAKQPQFQHPHRGGVVAQEFAERGLEELYLAQKRWLKQYWPKIIYKHYPQLRAVIAKLYQL